MNIDAGLVKELREKTGAGIMDCKKALASTNCDLEKAKDFLRQKGVTAAEKKVGRTAKEGLVTSYIHMGNRIGVLLEINCETDFVARTDDFQNLTKDITMQIASSSPKYVSKDDVPQSVIEHEKALYVAQAKEMGKPEAMLTKIAEGKLERFYGDVCLLEQPFIKDPSVKVGDLLTQKIASLGENIIIKRFTRYQLGEDIT